MSIADYKKNELNKMNVAKEILMLVVVLYHSMLCSAGMAWGPQQAYRTSETMNFLANYLEQVHVYAFTFVSGYIFAYIRYETNKYSDTKTVLKKKAKRLLVPYISTAFFWVIPFYVILWKPGFKDVIWKYIVGTGPNQLWFLLMLFWTFCFFQMLAPQITLERKNIWVFFCTFLFAVYLGILLRAKHVPNILQILTVMEYLLFFYLGILFRKIDTRKYVNGRSVCVGGTEYCPFLRGTVL